MTSPWRTPRGGLADRRAAAALTNRRDPRQVRADWVAAIDLAQRAAEAAMAGADAPAGSSGLVAQLMAGLRFLEIAGFPVKSNMATACAGAFLTVARAWVVPALAPEARTLAAPFLKAGALTLDAILDGLRREEAAVGRRATGEREDD